MATIIKTLSSLFCFLSFLSLIFSTTQTLAQLPDHMSTFCNQFSDNFTRTSPYRTNRAILLSSLREQSSLGTYSNVSTGLSPDKVNGMFLCRGDISKTSCSNCVLTATLEIGNNCTYQKEAFIFYEECMVRYSDSSFFSLVDERPYIIRYSLGSAPTSQFAQTLSEKMDDLIVTASSSPSYFVEDQEHVKQLEGSYDLDSIVQCSPDLDSKNCTVCLKLAVQEILDCCSRSSWAQIFTPKCLLRFETSAFSSPSPPPPPPSPPPPPPSPRSVSPSPPLFSRSQNVPSLSGSFSINNVVKGNEILGRIFIAVMTGYVIGTFGSKIVY